MWVFIDLRREGFRSQAEGGMRGEFGNWLNLIQWPQPLNQIKLKPVNVNIQCALIFVTKQVFLNSRDKDIVILIRRIRQ